jgi:hypothetical protein
VGTWSMDGLNQPSPCCRVCRRYACEGLTSTVKWSLQR